MKNLLRKIFGWVPIPRVWRRLDADINNEIEFMHSLINNMMILDKIKDSKLIQMVFETEEIRQWYSTAIAALALSHGGKIIIQKDFWETVQTHNPPFFLRRNTNEDGDITFELTEEGGAPNVE
jgi:hypothetical protein